MSIITLENLPDEIILMIIEKLTNVHDIISFTSVCYRLYGFRYLTRFNNIVNYNNISQLEYYQRFNKCIIRGAIESIPIFKTCEFTRLEFHDYEQSISALISDMNSLKNLYIHNTCKISTDDHIPTHIRNLTWNCNCPLKKNILSDGLERLEINNYKYKQLYLPSTLRHLTLGKGVEIIVKKKKKHFVISEKILPDGLESLTILCHVEFTENCLPASLKTVKIKKKYQHTIKNIVFSEDIKCIVI